MDESLEWWCGDGGVRGERRATSDDEKMHAPTATATATATTMALITRVRGRSRVDLASEASRVKGLAAERGRAAVDGGQQQGS